MSQDRPASVNLAFHGRGSVPPISKAAKKPTFSTGLVLGVPAVENLAWRCNLQRDSLVLIADRLSGARSKEEASSEPGGWR